MESDVRLEGVTKRFGKVTLTCYRSDGQSDNKPVVYLTVIMEHVIIADYKVTGGPGDIPVENVALHYGIVQYHYEEQKHANSPAGASKPAIHNLETHTVQ